MQGEETGIVCVPQDSSGKLILTDIIQGGARKRRSFYLPHLHLSFLSPCSPSRNYIFPEFASANVSHNVLFKSVNCLK